MITNGWERERENREIGIRSPLSGKSEKPGKVRKIQLSRMVGE